MKRYSIVHHLTEPTLARERARARDEVRRQFVRDHGREAGSTHVVGHKAIAFGTDWTPGEISDRLYYLRRAEREKADARRRRAATMRAAVRVSQSFAEGVASARPAVDALVDQLRTSSIPVPTSDPMETLVNRITHYPAHTFPVTAKPGATVRLTSRVSDTSVEFVVSTVTQDAYSGEVTAIRSSDLGLTFEASLYRFSLIKAAPVALPEAAGAYILRSARADYRAGRNVRVLVRSAMGTWSTAYGSEVPRKWSADDVRTYIGTQTLVPLSA